MAHQFATNKIRNCKLGHAMISLQGAVEVVISMEDDMVSEVGVALDLKDKIDKRK